MGNERDGGVRVLREGSRWVCVSCKLGGAPLDFDARDASDMLEHLRKHQQHGDSPPEKAVNALLRQFWGERR